MSEPASTSQSNYRWRFFRAGGFDQVRRDMDLPLFNEDLLDSLSSMELIVALSEQLGINISPAEIDRQQWSTPRKIIAYIEEKVKA